jgi:hypothetical protein
MLKLAYVAGMPTKLAFGYIEKATKRVNMFSSIPSEMRGLFEEHGH